MFAFQCLGSLSDIRLHRIKSSPNYPGLKEVQEVGKKFDVVDVLTSLGAFLGHLAIIVRNVLVAYEENFIVISYGLDSIINDRNGFIYTIPMRYHRVQYMFPKLPWNPLRL